MYNWEKYVKRTVVIVALAIAISILISRSAYASGAPIIAGKPGIEVGGVVTKGAQVQTVVAVRSVQDAAVAFSVTDPIAGKSLSFNASAIPVHLMVLVDASQLCRTGDVDTHVTALLGRLKTSLPARSSMSVATYSSSGFEILTADRKVSEVGNLPIRCESNLLSSSYEKALLRLVESVPDDGIKTVAWVFSSGNINVSSETAKKLFKRGASVHVLLYNPILEKELGKLIDSENLSAGGKVFSLSAFSSDAQSLPEKWFEITVPIPGYLQSHPMTLAIGARQKEVDFGSQTRTVSVDLEKKGGMARYGTAALAVLAGLLLVGVVYSVVRFYRPTKCRSCARLKRHGENHCVFCEQGDLAKLVGVINPYDRHKSGRTEVIYFGGNGASSSSRGDSASKLELGLRRRHDVTLKKMHRGNRSGDGALVAPQSLKSASRGTLATIVRENRGHGSKAFLFIPHAAGSFFVNQRLTETPRYLKNGDRIEFGQSKMTFVYGGIKNEGIRS